MTAYFGIVLLMPYVGRLFDALSRKQASMLVCALICVFSLFPSLYNADTFKLHEGYTMAWLMILAVIGGYIKRFDPLPHLKKSWLGLYSLCMSFVCGFKFLGVALGWHDPDRYICFTSVFVLLGSIGLMMFFARTDMGKTVRRITALAAPTALGVYLIHVHPCVWNFVLAGLFASLVGESMPVMLLGILCGAVGIFLLCSAVDWVRAKAFRLLRINKLADWVGERLTELANRIFES